MFRQTRFQLRTVVTLLFGAAIAMLASQAAAESFAPDFGSTYVEEKPDIGPPEVVDWPDVPTAELIAPPDAAETDVAEPVELALGLDAHADAQDADSAADAAVPEVDVVAGDAVEVRDGLVFDKPAGAQAAANAAVRNACSASRGGTAAHLWPVAVLLAMVALARAARGAAPTARSAPTTTSTASTPWLRR